MVVGGFSVRVVAVARRGLFNWRRDMREISKEELAEILSKHQQWLEDESTGERANLCDANLRDANLCGAEGQFFITQRSDGYQFFLVQQEDGEWWVRAGCRYLRIDEYREHTKHYSDEEKRIETNLILDFAEAKLKALYSESQEEAA